MTTHELKIWPEFFEMDLTVKPFEIRKNDRNYKTGDILVLKNGTRTKRRIPEEKERLKLHVYFRLSVYNLVGFAWVLKKNEQTIQARSFLR